MITFIAKPVFFRPGINGGVYPVRLSTRLRAEEIVQFLDGKVVQDPREAEGVRVHLKPRSLRHVYEGDYVDILDDFNLIAALEKRPGVKVIAYHTPHHDFLWERLDNPITVIPHAHINFENKTRTKNKQIVGGLISKSVPQVHKFFNEIKDRLAVEGIELRGQFEYQTREEMLQFYNDIDFQVIWYDNPPEDWSGVLIYPGKIINAASFGIPTIAQPIIGHENARGFYIPANTYEEIVRAAKRLQDERIYTEWSQKLLKWSHEYDMDNIIKLYKQL